jgi:hypothetical protein
MDNSGVCWSCQLDFADNDLYLCEIVREDGEVSEEWLCRSCIAEMEDDVPEEAYQE